MRKYLEGRDNSIFETYRHDHSPIIGTYKFISFFAQRLILTEKLREQPIEE